MTIWSRLIAVSTLVAALSGQVGAARADDAPSPAPEQPSGKENVAPDGQEARPAKRPFGLWVGVAGGTASADDINMSMKSSATDQTVASLALEDQLHVRAGLGWKLPEGKGDFRIVFQGFKDDDFAFSARGLQLKAIDTANGLPIDGNATCAAGEDIQTCLLQWWTVEASGGGMVARRDVPLFTQTEYLKDANGNVVFDADGNCIVLVQGDDTNCNSTPEPDEVHYDLANPSLIVQSGAPQTLENQVQTVDLLYGREFGRRRFSSRWWGGLRYFQYTGNLLASAWLNLQQPGNGFTDGAVLQPLILNEETSGIGPTGSWEVDFNFFNKGLVLFVRGQVAFTLNSMDIDSGPFPVPVDLGLSPLQIVTARIQESREKSSWQDQGEVGMRINLRNGLQFELGYSRTGLLDLLLIPSELTGLKSGSAITKAPSVLYTTQDYLLDGWHTGLAFQF